MEQTTLSEDNLWEVINKFELFQWKFLTFKQLVKLYGIEENTMRKYIKKGIGPNWHPKMFWEDYIQSHSEWWWHGALICIEPKEAVRFYLKHTDKLWRSYNNKTWNNYFYLDKANNESQNNDFKNESENYNNREEVIVKSSESKQPINEEQIIEIIEKILWEKTNNPSQDLSWYVDELKVQIEELKNEKKEVEKELKEESKRVEKVYFISDRFDKVINSQKAAMLDMIRMSQSLSAWEQIKLWEIKKLLSNLWNNEKVEIEENGNIRLIEDRSTWELALAMQSIPDDLILEKSRFSELEKMRKAKLLWIVLTVISLSIAIALIIAKILKVF